MTSSAAAVRSGSSAGARAPAPAAPRWRAPVLGTLLVPAGAALAAGLALAPCLTPGWTAGGLMHVTGYPKNVEITATLVAVALGASSALLVRWRRAFGVAMLLAAAGWTFGLWRAGTAGAAVVVPVLAGFVVLAIGLDRALAAPPRAATAPARTGERALAAAALTLLCLIASVQPVRTELIDAYHHGEVLLTALDLLRGGQPFVTLSWPHGLHDTGAAALWIALTGKIGSSPVALADVTVAGLAPLSLYLIARRVIGAPLATVTACAGAVALLVFAGVKGAHVGLVAIGASLCIAAAFAAASARPRPWPVAAGVALALAHLMRIDAGLYGVPAVGAVLAYRALADADRAPLARVRTLLRLGAGVACGAGLALVVLYASLGWPGSAWRAYVFGTVPHYHSAANGLPFPWPGTGAATRLVRAGTGALLLALVLAANALRRLALGGADCTPRAPGSARLELLLFLAVLAGAALRSGLGRSDLEHMLQWAYLPALGALLLIGAGAAAALQRRPVLHGIALSGVLALLGARVATGDDPPLAQLFEHLHPNPPTGACRDTIFTPRELTRAPNRAFVAASCAVEQTLREHGIDRFLIDHAAPWYYARFAVPVPSSPYSLSRAYAPADQWQLIADVRRAGVQALFKVRGFGAFDRYDVHNAQRMPIVEAFLRARRAGAPAVETPLGRLVLWNERAAVPAPSPPPAAVPAAELAPLIVQALYDPATEFLDLAGWIADARVALPLTLTLHAASGAEIEADVDVDPGRRPNVGQRRPTRVVSWSVVARLPERELGAAGFTLRLRAANGRWGETRLDPARVVRLPPRNGAEWSDLGAQVDAAEQLGRADRAAAQQ